VTPAHDADAATDRPARISLQHIGCRHDIVDLGAAVIDRVVEGLAVADAAALFRRDDDVASAALRGCRECSAVQVTADVFVHPDDGRMSLAPRILSG